MRKSAYLLLSLLFCVSCGVSETEYLALQDQNEKLKNEITDLKNRISESDYLQAHSQVALANTELKEISSSAIGQNFKIKIHLPRGYAQSSQSYPTLYITDAETNFGGISYIVQRLIKDKLIPPMIVVGIAYGTDYKTFYELRSRDLTPIEDAETRIGGKIDPTGGAPAFSNFISQELFPFIEGNYRVDKYNRALYGHSYGGLFGAYVLLSQPELFSHYLILSPSLWFKDEYMLSQVEKLSPSYNATRVYMGSGELEGRIDDLQTEFVAKLKAKNLEGLDIKSEIMPNETHRTIFGPAFTNGMRYLFE